MKNNFDIVIVGAGHAGIEAAWACASHDLDVALVTMPGVSIGSTPCNPAVGGVGKGQVVREIDALGGIMGKIADLSALQYRTLNESKGYAVHSTRVQVDKDIYSNIATKIVQENPNISLVYGAVESIMSCQNHGCEYAFEILHSGSKKIMANKIIVTAGTFLNGKLHVGSEQVSGGRVDCKASLGMKDLFVGVETLKTKFKTGTPPRLSKRSIDFSKMIPQKSDKSVSNFHFQHKDNERFIEQSTCYLTRTNPDTLKIIRSNKEKSPIFNGQINGVGPRYCPSIEDKAFRYPDRDSHHIFIEPEGLTCNTYYPNGMSTSLPKNIQLDFIRTIDGLEEAEIDIYGYAVEYDVVNTSKLNICLEYEDIKGLYFAGQMNGTSGYEEAAGQGLIAGHNAALALKGRDIFTLSRSDSYIGVMIEDLVTNLRDEPYRLFTARSENRLFIREDNTINRMAKYRRQLGLKQDIDTYMDNYLYEYDILLKLCKSTKYSVTDEVSLAKFKERTYGEIFPRLTLSDLLKRSKIDPVKTLIAELDDFGAMFNPNVIKAVAIAIKYEGYMKRAQAEQEKLNRLDGLRIDWEKLYKSNNLSNECKQRIEAVRPSSFSQLKRIDGIRPATLAYVAGNLI